METNTTDPVSRAASPEQRGASASSLLLLFSLTVLALPLVHLWAVWLLPLCNNDHLGCDACHHAVLVYCQSLSNPVERAFLADTLTTYPQTAHWLAACWMPLLGGDPFKAMRAVTVVSLLLMLVCQFALLWRFLPAGLAMLALLVWQMVCYLTNTANTQYYCVAYFYSQGVGMAFVWLALLLWTHPARTPWLRTLLTTLGTGFAGLAYLCHIVPGVAVLGGLGTYSLAHWLWSRSRWELFRIALVAGVGLAVVLGTSQLAHMGQARQDTGTVPLKNWGLLVTWVPTLLFALGVILRSWRKQGLFASTGNRDQQMIELLGVLTCVLGVTGLLQGYCALEYLLGKSALYSANKFFYVLFPVASLLWLLAGIDRLRRRQFHPPCGEGLACPDCRGDACGSAPVPEFPTVCDKRAAVRAERPDEREGRAGTECHADGQPADQGTWAG